MKTFFYTLFGGLLAIGVGVGISYGGAVAWKSVSSHFVRMPADFFSLKFPKISISKFSLTAAAEAVLPTPHDGTFIAGWKRSINYVEADEQDLDIFGAAAQSLVSAADGKITGRSYLVKNLTRGDVAIEHNADTLLPIASLTKLVTAVIARRHIDQENKIVITREVYNTEGNSGGLRIGETLKAGDLLYPMLMVSSNDAAEALAREYGRAEFIKAMNEFVQSIGAYRTYFADPSGLSPRNVSTANDLALILKWLNENDPRVIEITKTKIKIVRPHTWVNPTHFLNWSNYAGGKNGYLPEANRTGATLFSLGPRKNLYAVVLLGSESRDSDVMKLLGKVKE